MNKKNNQNYTWAFLTFLLIFVGSNFLATAATVDHSPKWSGSTLTYGLTDLDKFPALSYQYCKWGNLQDLCDRELSLENKLDFTKLTKYPPQNDLFLAYDSDSYLLRYSLDNREIIWNTVSDENDRTKITGIEGYVPLFSLESARLYRYLHFRNDSLIDVKTGKPLTGNETKVIILFHGWNPDVLSDFYTEKKVFSNLITNLKQAVAASDWTLAVYHWEADADTGAVFLFDSAINKMTFLPNNGAEAAEISHQHGQHLGELLTEMLPNLRKIHVIAHSAGSWAARSTLRYLLSYNSMLSAQMTLLDPFVPAAAGATSSLSTQKMNDFSEFETLGLDRLENYFSEDKIVFGTQERFTWTGRNQYFGVNIKVDTEISALNLTVETKYGYSDFDGETILGRLHGHDGPIQFYADSVQQALWGGNVGDLRFVGAMEGDSSGGNALGFYNSMIFNEPRVSAPEIIEPRTDLTKDNTILSGLTIKIRAKTETLRSYFSKKNGGPDKMLPSFRWYWVKDGHDGIFATTETDTLEIKDAKPSDSGTYYVLVMDSLRFECYAFSETIDIVVKTEAAADIVFLLDTTGSMEDTINNCKATIQRIANGLNAQGIDWRAKVVGYKDIDKDGSAWFKDAPFVAVAGNASNPTGIYAQLNALSASGGGMYDFPESTYDAVWKVSNSPTTAKGALPDANKWRDSSDAKYCYFIYSDAASKPLTLGTSAAVNASESNVVSAVATAISSVNAPLINRLNTERAHVTAIVPEVYNYSKYQYTADPSYDDLYYVNDVNIVPVTNINDLTETEFAEIMDTIVDIVVTKARENVLNVSTTTLGMMAKGDSGYIKIATNQDLWTAEKSTNASWLTLSQTSGTDGAFLEITAAKNTGAARSGVVTVRAGTASTTITVTQAAAPAPSVSVSATSWKASENGGAKSVTVTTNQATWTAEKNAPWLTLSPTSGANGATLTITAARNPGATRSGTVTVRAGTASATITVTQAAETWDLSGLTAKGVKLTPPKTLVVPKGTKLAKGTKAVYVWKDASGNVLRDAKGKPVSAKTYTTKTNGEYTVELHYTPLAADKVTALPEVVMVHSFGKAKLFDPIKIAKVNGFVAEPLGIQVLDAKGRPAANTVVEGEKMRFIVKLESGTGPLKYIWYQNKVAVKTTGPTYALTDTFETPAIGAKPDAFSVVVETIERDAKGVKPLTMAKSKAIKPKVVLTPKVTITTPASKLVAAVGKNVTIAAKATGTAKLNFEWRGPDGKVVVDAKGKPINKASLALAKVTAAHAGTYTVCVTNGAGEKHAARASAVVTVTGANVAVAKTGISTLSVNHPASSVVGKSALASTTLALANTNTPDSTMMLERGTTLRLTDAITGDVSTLTLTDDSQQNLRCETIDANTTLVTFNRTATWRGLETVTLRLAFNGENYGEYGLMIDRVILDEIGNLTDETVTQAGLFEME